MNCLGGQISYKGHLRLHLQFILSSNFKFSKINELTSQHCTNIKTKSWEILSEKYTFALFTDHLYVKSKRLNP
jgi:hypothetical protein